MSRRTSRAFTLIEVLVVVAVIALLIGILLPSLSAARQSARKAQCGANFTNIGKAWHMYANDHRDAFPASWAGGTWNLVYDFNKFYFDRRKLGGDIFMCPTWEALIDPSGKPYGWNNLWPITSSHGKAVLTGYSIWTNLITDPYKSDGSLEWIPVREYSRTRLPPSAAGTWAEYLVDQRLIPPWLNKSSDMGGLVRDTNVTNGWSFIRKRYSPSNLRMAWDQVTANRQLYPGKGFHPTLVRHFGNNGPTGANVLFGDGSVKWRPFSTMIEVQQSTVHFQYY